MKALLIGESRDGKVLPQTYETVALARTLGAEAAMFLVGNPAGVPHFAGKLYLADVAAAGEYNPDGHLQTLLGVVEREQPQLIVFSHTSYGWDLAPRLAQALGAAQISEVVALADGAFVVPLCNAKLRRTITVPGAVTVVTLQPGAFAAEETPSGTPTVEMVAAASGAVEFLGFEVAERGGVDLTRAEVIVSAGRGIGKPEVLPVVEALAQALGGELGASRPVVDAGWVPHNRQVGSTGQTVTPKLYVACGISGAIQHLAGMKRADFIVAINTDRDAPIGEVADVLVVADLKQFVPLLTEKIKALH